MHSTLLFWLSPFSKQEVVDLLFLFAVYQSVHPAGRRQQQVPRPRGGSDVRRGQVTPALHRPRGPHGGADAGGVQEQPLPDNSGQEGHAAQEHASSWQGRQGRIPRGEHRGWGAGSGRRSGAQNQEEFGVRRFQSSVPHQPDVGRQLRRGHSSRRGIECHVRDVKKHSRVSNSNKGNVSAEQSTANITES